MSTHETEEFETTVPLSRSHGIHLGPSGRISMFVQATECQVQLTQGNRTVDAASVASLMALEDVLEGDEITITVHGPDAQRVGMSLARFLTGMDEEFDIL